MRLHSHTHGHEHPERHVPHDHSHGALDPALLTTERGIWAVQGSMLMLLLTAMLQGAIVWLTSSVALLADTIHNFGDAATAIPLWIAFSMARRKASKRFTYGYGRVEDVAGIVILFVMLFSGIMAARTAITALLQPQEVQYPMAIGIASVLGFLGNEFVARFRIRIGTEIGSAALITDGYHARADGLTSLGVLLGAMGVWIGFPQADPLVGLVITIVIFKIVWDSGKSLLSRLLDGVDPDVVDEVKHAAGDHVAGVLEVSDVRVRRLGHRMLADVNIAVESTLSVEQGHEIAREARHQLLHHLPYLANATIHIDPASASGEHHHGISAHHHDEWPTHSH